MKNYLKIPIQGENWCLPVCLQIVLASKDLRVSQKEIADALKVDGRGFNGEVSDISKYLQKQGFKCEHIKPNEVFEGIDFWLNDNFSGRDILIAYDEAVLVGGRVGLPKHFSVMVDYENSFGGKAKIYEPCSRQVMDFSLNHLTAAMPMQRDDRFGFYAIEKM